MTHKMFSFTGSGCKLTGVYSDNNKKTAPYALYSHCWVQDDNCEWTRFHEKRHMVARFMTASELLRAAANVAAHGHI